MFTAPAGGANGPFLADGRAVREGRTGSVERHAWQGACRRSERDVRVLNLEGAGRTNAPRYLHRSKKALFSRFAGRTAKGGVGRVVRGPRPSRRTAFAGADRLHCREGSPLRRGRQEGERSQVIGRSRGGRTTKIYALTDRFCRPLAFLLTGWQAADCKAGALLLERLPACRIVLADKGYDTDAIRRQMEAAGAAPNISPESNRRWKPCFSPMLYRGRNAIERMFGRLMGVRRIATRYDRLASNYLASICLAATISCWLCAGK